MLPENLIEDCMPNECSDISVPGEKVVKDKEEIKEVKSETTVDDINEF